MSLLYGYLLSTKKIALPTSSDKRYQDDSPEIESVLEDMFCLVRKERSFIRDVYNATIDAVQEKEASDRIEADEKLQLAIEQKKKLAAAKSAVNRKI